MDGTRSHDEIIERLRLAHPELPDPESIVEQLTATRMSEDAAAVPPAGLSERERDRYSRNHAFFRTVDIVPRGHGWETQLRLKSARVVVLGLGGTGCHAAWALAAVGVGTIHCVDPDLVELSNLNRQVLYGEGDVGRPKAEAAVARLRTVNSDISVTGERRHIGSRRELDELIAGYDALALCADRPTGHDIRVWANRACAAAGIPWAGGGYNGPLVTVGCFAPGAGACYECLSSGEEARRHPDTPVDLGGPGVIATSAGVSGQLVAHALLGLLTGVPVPPVGTIQGVNLIAADHHGVGPASASARLPGVRDPGRWAGTQFNAPNDRNRRRPYEQNQALTAPVNGRIMNGFSREHPCPLPFREEPDEHERARDRGRRRGRQCRRRRRLTIRLLDKIETTTSSNSVGNDKRRPRRAGVPRAAGTPRPARARSRNSGREGWRTPAPSSTTYGRPRRGSCPPTPTRPSSPRSSSGPPTGCGSSNALRSSSNPMWRAGGR